MTESTNACIGADSNPPRAVAYYRYSGLTGNHASSLLIQQRQVRNYAQGHGIDIISEIYDLGGAGRLTEEREGLNHLMNDWVRKRHDFSVILCVDGCRIWRDWYLYDQFVELSNQCRKTVVWTSPDNGIRLKS